MIPWLRFTVAAALITTAAVASSGLSPRADASDYDVHQAGKNVTIAASILPPEKAARIFSTDVSRHYVVVEIGVFPENGTSTDIALVDFALKTPDARNYPATPAEVAWHGKRPPPPPSISSNGPHVAVEAGVAYGTRTNPATGRTDKGVETWTAASVDNAPRRPNPPSRSANDAADLEDKLDARELPEGPTTRSVAGYLYFPAPAKKSKNPALVLEYSGNGERIDLRLN